MKSDSEKSIKALRDAVARFHAGIVIPEAPAKGESQRNGPAEESSKTVREFVKVLLKQLEDKVGKKEDRIKEENCNKKMEWRTAWTKGWLRRQQMVHRPREQRNYVKEEEKTVTKKEEKELHYLYLQLYRGENGRYMS